MLISVKNVKFTRQQTLITLKILILFTCSLNSIITIFSNAHVRHGSHAFRVATNRSPRNTCHCVQDKKSDLGHKLSR